MLTPFENQELGERGRELLNQTLCDESAVLRGFRIDAAYEYVARELHAQLGTDAPEWVRAEDSEFRYAVQTVETSLGTFIEAFQLPQGRSDAESDQLVVLPLVLNSAFGPEMVQEFAQNQSVLDPAPLLAASIESAVRMGTPTSEGSLNAFLAMWRSGTVFDVPCIGNPFGDRGETPYLSIRKYCELGPDPQLDKNSLSFLTESLVQIDRAQRAEQLLATHPDPVLRAHSRIHGDFETDAVLEAARVAQSSDGKSARDAILRAAIATRLTEALKDGSSEEVLRRSLIKILDANAASASARGRGADANALRVLASALAAPENQTEIHGLLTHFVRSGTRGTD